MPPELRYALDGLIIGVGGAPALVAMLARRLAALDRSDAPLDVRVELLEVAEPSRAIPRGAPGRKLFEEEYDFGYVKSDDRIYLASDGVAATCEPVAGRIRIAARPDDDRARVVATHVIFTLSLLEVLKRRGRFAVHAGAVAREGRAVLLAGPSGSGKTTLTLACLRAGFAFLGDDVAILKDDRAGTLALRAFPDEIGIGAHAITLLPEFARAIGPSVGPSGKRSLAIDDLAVARTDRGDPTALVFPRVVPHIEAELAPITPDDALIRLTPNVVRTERGSTQRHLDALARLARAVPAYELAFGEPSAAAATLSGLMGAC